MVRSQGALVRGTRNVSIYRWLNGLTVVPTVVGLLRSGLLQALGSAPACTLPLSQMASLCPSARTGAVCAMFRTLALQGWAGLAGRDSDTVVHLTPAGQAVLRLAIRHADVLSHVVAYTSTTSMFRRLLRKPCDAQEGWLADFAVIMEMGHRNWDIAAHEAPDDQVHVIEHLIAYLDGLILCPLIVALGMPDFELSNGRLIELSPAIADLEQRALRPIPGCERGLELAAQFLNLHGLVNAANAQSPGQLSDAGVAVLSEAANFGVPVSYQGVYSQPERILMPIERSSATVDEHVDRIINIWGSGNSTVLKRFRHDVHADVLSEIFDALPLEQQPIGIADMGAGSGHPLREMVDFVLHHTRRGRHLEQFPLVVVGADYSPAACSRLRETLSDLNQLPGVTALTIQADVGDPDTFDQRIRASGIVTRAGTMEAPRAVTAQDFLHTHMFLLHDRELHVSSSAKSRDIIDAHATSANRFAVEDALAQVAAPADHSDSAVTDVVLDAFSTCASLNGVLIPGATIAADLIALLDKWRPYLGFGLVLLEPHVPRLERCVKASPDEVARDAQSEVDPGPAVWGIHFASNQFLMPRVEQELAIVLAGFSPAYMRSTATEGVSATWWVASDKVYVDADTVWSSQ